MRNYYLGFGLVFVLFLVSLGIVFFQDGSPWQKRREKLDEKRINDFKRITYSIQAYVLKSNKMPESLTDLETPGLNIKDPETGDNYDYGVVDYYSYKLCTKFSTEVLEDVRTVPLVLSIDDYNRPVIYSHKKGYDCLNFGIPNSYPKSTYNNRSQTNDEIRMSDFNNIFSSIQNYYSINHRLPEKLRDLGLTSVSDKDPKTREFYEYKVVDKYNFKLCTTFDEEVLEDYGTYRPQGIKIEPPNTDPKKGHKKGYDCLTYGIPSYYRIDPINYDPFKDSKSHINDIPTHKDAFISPKGAETFNIDQPITFTFKNDPPGSTLFIVDSNNIWKGHLNSTVMCSDKSPNCTATWYTKNVYDYSNNSIGDLVMQAISISPGKYFAILFSSSEGLVGKSGVFTIK